MAQTDTWQPIYEADDVLLLVKQKAEDSSAYYEHLQAGTIDEYYKTIVETVAMHLAMIPLERETKKLKEIADYDDINEAVTGTVDILARMFRKMPLEVGALLQTSISLELIKDFRTSRRQSLDGGLH